MCDYWCSYFHLCVSRSTYWLGVSFLIDFSINLYCYFFNNSFPILVEHDHIYFPIIFGFALFYTISNYLFASLHDPGVIPRPNADEVLQTEKEYNIQTDL